jgi:oxygen-independent coproporphyrinogen-3 oxidase
MRVDLLKKYDIPVPRYTSYPTVPHWNSVAPARDFWEKAVKDAFTATNDSEGISLYIHLPFCEKLCTYCGCNTRITINHAVEEVYIKAVQREWENYLTLFDTKPRLRELHLGGGTPTFFSPENLHKLLTGLLESSIVPETHEFSFEAHPGNTTEGHLQVLFDLGFRRVSIGVQDFDPAVLEIINRHQTYEDVLGLVDSARRIGYSSVNFDLVYGLPLQQAERFEDTIKRVIELRPDRIALYSYAHVPWIKPGQRKFTESDLPQPDQKLALYRQASNRLIASGYVSIGMDHFALPDDALCVAQNAGQLHRNFMGYTVNRTQLLIGLGASAISDAGAGYVQNEKKVEDYYSSLKENKFPFFKGHVMTDEDLRVRGHILDIMCRLRTGWSEKSAQTESLYEALGRLEELQKDGLVILQPFEVEVTSVGRHFLRNVCHAFDQRSWESQVRTVQFSRAV